LPVREQFDEDLYALLGVPDDASPSQVRLAYRSLARRLHPDARPGDHAASERFRQVNRAYRVLSHPARRAEYDARRPTPPGGPRPAPWPATPAAAAPAPPPRATPDPTLAPATAARAATNAGAARAATKAKAAPVAATARAARAAANAKAARGWRARRLRRALATLALPLLVAVALVLAVVGGDLDRDAQQPAAAPAATAVHGDNGEQAKPAGLILADARRALHRARSFVVDGRIPVGSDPRALPIEGMALTITAGGGNGLIVLRGAWTEVQLLSQGGRTYVAGQDLWRAAGYPAQVTADLGDSLALIPGPGSGLRHLEPLADVWRRLDQLLTFDGPRKAGSGMADGMPAVLLRSVDGGTTVAVAASGPPYPLQITTAPDLPGSGGMPATLTLDRFDQAALAPDLTAALPRALDLVHDPRLLLVGTCFDPIGRRAVRFSPCASAHRDQVFALVQLPRGSYPGDAQARAQADAACRRPFAAVARGSLAAAGPLGYGGIPPDRAAWSRGDRTVACGLHRLDGRQRTGSLVYAP
jgi:DnaJ-domain-containing protein 1